MELYGGTFLRLENSFHVALPVESAWATLLDIPSIAPCMPGTELLAVEDEQTYRGQVKVKLGPVAVAFRGRAKLVEVDEGHRRVRINAAGSENKGRGSAQAEVAFILVPDGEGTRVDIVTDLILAGSVAQYGRAQGIIAGVARVMIESFAKNLRTHIDTAGAGSGEASASGKSTPALSAFSIGTAVVRGWATRNKEQRQP
jgi:carbon monoxide dehydrogenase subunit G